MEEAIKLITSHTAILAEGIAALIIAIASLQCLYLYFRYLFSTRRDQELTLNIRVKLGQSLSLALEFLLGADILQTAIAPTWNEIGQLAAIAILRTALNYFLERELRNEEKHKAEDKA